MAASGAFELSPRQAKALEVLVSGGSTSEAATAAGVSVRTIQRWLHREDFKQALRQAQAEVMEALTRRLRALGTRAVETLGQVMGDKLAPPSSRVSGAKCVLESIFRLTELEKMRELEERISAIEQRLNVGGR